MSNILDKIKLSGTTYDIVDSTAIHSLDGYWTSGQTTSAITAATAALAETIGEELSAKTDESAFTAYTAATDATLTGKADTTAVTADIAAAVSGYADSVAYDSGTTTMNFYHGGTGGTVVYSFDASPFVIDGMIDDVRIETLSGTTYLVIDFNTASGKEDILIPLTDIFDPSNYYDKDATDAAISAATSGKADTSAVTAVNDVLTAHTANTTVHVTAEDKTAWSGKQDALVSGTNIKTVGGTSLLGSGDVPFPDGMTAEVSGTTLIFNFN